MCIALAIRKIHHFPGARSSRAYSFGSRRTRVARASSSQDIQSRRMVSHHRIADVAPVISQSIHERVTRHHAHINAVFSIYVDWLFPLRGVDRVRQLLAK